MLGSRSKLGVLGALVTVFAGFGCSSKPGVFLDLSLVPDEVRWLAVLPRADNNLLQPGSGLYDRNQALIEFPLELAEVNTLVLIGYRDDFVDPRPTAEVLRDRPLRPDTDLDHALPRPAFALLGSFDDGEFVSRGEVEVGAVSADWVSCPSGLGEGGFVLPSCLNCEGRLRRNGCRLEADLGACMFQGFDVHLGPTGAMSSFHSDEPRLGSCSLSPSPTALSASICSFPERAGGCELALIEAPEPDPTDELALANVEPYDDPFAGARFAGGYAFGMAILESEIAVVTTGAVPQTWHCQVAFEPLASEVVYVDRSTFQITRTATSAACLRWPQPDPANERGFLAYFIQGGEGHFGRFDASARLVDSVPLGDLGAWIVSDTIMLSPRRVAITLQDAQARVEGRVVFVDLSGPRLRIDLDYRTGAVLITGGSRVSDTALGVLSDSSDNIRVVDGASERGLRYLTEDCGLANLSSAGFWMSEDERLAVAAVRENGTLLVLSPAEGQCRFAHAPTHPEVVDPIAIAPAGRELAVSFLSRSEPYSSSVGRFDLEQLHMTRAYTKLGPGVVNELLADGEWIYATITDRARLVRLGSRP